jgi:hypothetical protein
MGSTRVSEQAADAEAIAIRKARSNTAHHVINWHAAAPLPGGRSSARSKTLRHGVVVRLTQAEKHRRAIAQRYFAERIR